MPKKIPILEKRLWLQDYEQGKSEAAIASDNHRDIRIIKKGIEEARRERVANLARADLVKDALRHHNEILLNIVQEIRSALKSPPSTQPVPWKWQTSTNSIPVQGGKAEYEYWEQPTVFIITLDVERNADWRFFVEHIKPDRLWKLLNQWKKVLGSHLEARMVVKRSLSKLLKNDQKEPEASEAAKRDIYILTDEPVAGDFIYFHSVDTIFQIAIQKLLGLANTSTFEDNITVDTNGGDVRYGGTILAHATSNGDKYKKHIIGAFKELLKMHEGKNKVISTYMTLEELTAKVRQAAEEISSMRLVPGQCRICRRLGL